MSDAAYCLRRLHCI